MNVLTKPHCLMVAAMALTTFATTNSLSAQIVINSPDDIVLPGDGAIEAYYDASTGEVYLALGDAGSAGSNVAIAGIAFVDEQLIFANFDNTTALGGGDPATITQIAFLNLGPDFIGFGGFRSGIFNIGNILPADPSITDIASFQASPFGDAQLQFSSFPNLGPNVEGFLPFNVIAAVPEPGSLSLFTLAGLAAVTRRRR